MKPGQTLYRWWQEYVLGRLSTPQDLYRAALFENPDPARASDRFFGGLAEVAHWEAPWRLLAPVFMKSEAFLRQGGRADWQHCDARLMRWAALFQEYARKRQIPLYVHTAFRSEAEQAKVGAGGHSKVTFPNSAHNIGEAVDVVHSVFHWDLTRAEWSMLHTLGLLALDRVNADLPKALKLRLVWGGDWKFYDPAHWEIQDYRTRTRRLPLGEPVRLMPRAILRLAK